MSQPKLRSTTHRRGSNTKPFFAPFSLITCSSMPAHFRVIRHRRPTLACTCCDRIMQAAASSRPVSLGIPSQALLAHHRGIEVRLSHSTASSGSHVRARWCRDRCRRDRIDYWMGSVTQLLAPLVDAVRCYTLGGSKVHADDMPLPMLAPGNGRMKTGRLWVYVRDDRSSASDEAPAVWFAYTPCRRGEHPSNISLTYGVLRADALAGYADLDRGGRHPRSRLIGSARLNGPGQESHLHHVIDRIADHPINRVDELLPVERHIVVTVLRSRRTHPLTPLSYPLSTIYVTALTGRSRFSRHLMIFRSRKLLLRTKIQPLKRVADLDWRPSVTVFSLLELKIDL